MVCQEDYKQSLLAMFLLWQAHRAVLLCVPAWCIIASVAWHPTNLETSTAQHMPPACADACTLSFPAGTDASHPRGLQHTLEAAVLHTLYLCLTLIHQLPACRQKYPHILAGSIAGSAPIWTYYGEVGCTSLGLAPKRNFLQPILQQVLHAVSPCSAVT